MTNSQQSRKPKHSRIVPGLDDGLLGTAQRMFPGPQMPVDLHRWRLTEEELVQAGMDKALRGAYEGVATVQLANTASLVARLAEALQDAHTAGRYDYAWCQFCSATWYTHEDVGAFDRKEEWHTDDCRYIALLLELRPA